MPSPVSDGGEPAARYRAAQAGLARLLVRDMRRLRRLIVPSRLRTSVADWITASRTVVDQYAAHSADLASDYYRAQREAARVPGQWSPPAPELPPQDQVDNSLRWAASDLWPRDPADPGTTEAQRLPLEQRLDAAEARAEGAAQKAVADAGRAQVRTAASQDRRAVGLARWCRTDGCAFCKLMASRGAVYRLIPGYRQPNIEAEGGVWQFHDHCQCGIRVVWAGEKFELSPAAQQWADLYEKHAANAGTGDKMRAFRAAVAAHDSGL